MLILRNGKKIVDFFLWAQLGLLVDGVVGWALGGIG